MENTNPKFLIGELGAKYLLEELTKTNQPFKLIDKFQKENELNNEEDKSQKKPTAYFFDSKFGCFPFFLLASAIPLLNLHGISRTTAYQDLIPVLRSRLVQQIQIMPDNL